MHAVQAIPIHPDESRRASGATVHGPGASERCAPSARPVAMQRETQLSARPGEVSAGCSRL
eukprot:8528705-Alexandrium_andersonii.AAC.1